MKACAYRSVGRFKRRIVARGHQESNARDRQQESAGEVAVKRLDGAGDNGKTRRVDRGWQSGNNPGIQDCKSINIRDPARKYTQPYVFVQSFGEGQLLFLYATSARRARRVVARSAMPELGLCKGIAVEMENRQRCARATTRR